MDKNMKSKKQNPYPPCEIVGAVDGSVTAAQIKEGVIVRLEVLLGLGTGIMFVLRNKVVNGGPAVLVDAETPLTIHEAEFTPDELDGWEFPVGATIEVWAYFNMKMTPIADYTIVA